MLFSTLSMAVTTLAVLTSSINAMPAWPKWPQPAPRGTSLTRLAALMPKSTLAAPTGELKYVLLGIGTQNYTCTTGDDNASPGTTGALAKLYDLGSRLDKDPMAQYKINTISGLALSLKSAPFQLDGYLKSQGYEYLLGDHFFTESTPTFSLNQVKQNPFPLAFVLKKGEMDAPKTSCPGTQKEGAVKWLQLVDDQNRSQGGINTVYRLETAGGDKPQTCKGMKKTFEVPYAAQYWVFGPASY